MAAVNCFEFAEPQTVYMLLAPYDDQLGTTHEAGSMVFHTEKFLWLANTWS